MSKQPIFLCFIFFVLVAGCHNKPALPPLFQLLDSTTGINFTNKISDTKELNIINYRNFYNGGGAAIGDINNDGLADVFFTANQGSNKLYINKGNWKFEDVSAKVGFSNKLQWSTGVVMADINNDGWLDIFISNAGSMNNTELRRNQLYINNHGFSFTESAKEYGLDDSGYTTQASFFDYDMDGDLDCFIINNSPVSPASLNYVNTRDLPLPINQQGEGDHLFRNDNGKFTDVTKQAGIHGSLISFGLGVTVGDVNNDGYPDVYISNDYFERDYLYINQKNGTFKDELESWVQHTSLASMGADIGDINNDGYPDIFTTDMLPGNDFRLKANLTFEDINVFRIKERNGLYYQFFQNTLQLNNKNGKFLDIANYAHVAATDWSWGGLMFDADNDGYNDLFVCNGIYHDLINQDFLDFFANDIMQKMYETGKKGDIYSIINKMPSIPLENKAYQNNGHLQFNDVSDRWGFEKSSFSNGAAYGDLDNDGDLDMVINNVNEASFIYKNNAIEQNKNNYISILLRGMEKNTFAIGSKIKIFADGQQLSREVMPGRGFQSSVDYKVVIGLGKLNNIDSMIVQWPDLSQSVYYAPSVNKFYQLFEEKEKRSVAPLINFEQANAVLKKIPSNFDKHTEDDCIDFFNERGLPKMLSREGPKAAIGDVNNDGLQDVYIGGTIGHLGQLYLQDAQNRFIKKEEKSFAQFLDFEDGAILFFDADNDGDLDLFLGPAGNSEQSYSRQMQNRLFMNGGKGDYTLYAPAFKNNGMNTSVAAAYDFDHDGDVDLFVGGRSVPMHYGTNPCSYIYVNDGKGNFTDIAKTKNADIYQIGMVTSAVWANVAGDSSKELIIAGEWMAPSVFSYNGDHFIQVKTNINNLYGWWQTITATDINNDGKTDLLLGNIGKNCYLYPTFNNPIKLWVNDFDNNNATDKIMTYSVNGKDVPVFLKHDIEDQIPSIKKRNLKHTDFAKASMKDLFSEDILKKSMVKQFNYCASVVAVNKGNGNFTIQQMPVPLQLSSVNAIVATDVNNDGYADIITGGNEFGFIPQLERLDASLGNILINSGKGNFINIDASHTGLELRGMVRDIKELSLKNKKLFLILQNNQYPLLYSLNNKTTFATVKKSK